MPPQRPVLPTSLEHLEFMLTDDGSRTLRDRRLNETYHSGCGALSECIHVYLRNSGIETLLQQSAKNDNATEETTQAPHVVRVLEFGFGTGMAALLTLAAAQVYRSQLEYVSLERDLLPRAVLDQMVVAQAVDLAIQRGQLPAEYSVMTELEQAWLDFRSQLPTVVTHGEYVWSVAEHIRLRLIVGDAVDFAAGRNRLQPALTAESTGTYDAIYLDAFSPATNPELWSPEVFTRLKTSLAPDGLLVSYCVSGQVRRGLQQAGFEVMRLPGPPGGKREVLAARA